ncbi:TetR/AcrR family transcriptional regulator [Rhodococcus sp. WAY2]|uniref:TetR/AcrR family transcriptional regulator n=1 Tax=Rhodococcus sp. WAY2 TaxID=2663121 RepID=UPI0013203C26|nr:TetR/AcrR family transcriptional regulator [Rhodococcus sp. WAY2]QHE66659.1 putative transcriptional regulator [Rhodococcus sp. WAY2]
MEIAENASELFSSRGFHAVRMEDIAEASGITARALYRHYANKQALLAHVVREDQQRVIETLTALTEQPADERGLDASLTALTNSALESRQLSLLWQREARHLDADDYRLVRRQTRWIAEKFEALLIDSERDDLNEAAADIRSWVVVSIVSGPGLYASTLSRPRLAQDLIAASKRVINEPAAVAADAPPDNEVHRTSISRREQLIYAAARAFRDKGFGGVSIDDIGGQLGIVGPALYRYFDNKADILVATVNRLQEWLALEMTRAMRTRCPDEEMLPHLVQGYVRIALEETDLLAVSLTERLYLPATVSERIDRVQADYIAEWQRWLSVARPDLSEARAATLVKTAKTVIDDCVRIPHLRQYRDFPAELTHATLATLGLQLSSPVVEESA